MSLRIGQEVKLKDFSYGKRITSNGNLDHIYDRDLGITTLDATWTIVAIDCKLPASDSVIVGKQYNDVIVRHTATGAIAFTMSVFVKPIKRDIIIDGKTIEISEESFQELKRQLCS